MIMLEINFTPFPVLSSERLLLREIAATDVDRLHTLRSDPTSMKYLDKAPLKDKEEAQALLDKMLADVDTNNAIIWAIALKDKPSLLIGTISFWRIMKEHYRAELGYMLLPDYFNKGYMTEAINTANAYAFSTIKLHSIEAHINPDNAASAAILLKTGFIKEAHFKEDFYYNGKFLDTAVYSLLNPAK